MHCGKKWRIREFVAPDIFPLNPDYVAAHSLQSLCSNKHQGNTRWAFAQKLDIFTFAVLSPEIFFNTRREISYLRVAM